MEIETTLEKMVELFSYCAKGQYDKAIAALTWIIPQHIEDILNPYISLVGRPEVSRVLWSVAIQYGEEADRPPFREYLKQKVNEHVENTLRLESQAYSGNGLETFREKGASKPERMAMNRY